MAENKNKSKRKVIITVAVLAVLSVPIGIAWHIFSPSLFAEHVPVSEVSEGTTSIEGQSDILIVYFSRAGNTNYTSDKVDAISSASLTICDDKVRGNSEVLALAAQKATGGDIFFIETEDKYPQSYMRTFLRNRKEQSEGSSPVLATRIENMEQYSKMIIVYPCWMGSVPRPVMAFLESYDFSDKIIYPVVSSTGSGLGATPEQISSACPSVTITEGCAAGSEADIIVFLEKAGL